MRIARDVAIIMALAALVAFAPAGGNAAEVVLAVVSMAFLTVIAWAIYNFGRQNQLTLAALGSLRRATLYGALGLIALLIAGSDELFSTGIGTLAWILLLAAAITALAWVWTEANKAY